MKHHYLHAHIVDGELIIAVIVKTLEYAVAILKVRINNKQASQKSTANNKNTILVPLTDMPLDTVFLFASVSSTSYLPSLAADSSTYFYFHKY